MQRIINKNFYKTILNNVEEIEFIECRFYEVIIANGIISNCRFIRCNFNEIYLGNSIIDNNVIENCKFSFCALPFSDIKENLIFNTISKCSNYYKTKFRLNVMYKCDFQNDNFYYTKLDKSNKIQDTVFNVNNQKRAILNSQFNEFISAFFNNENKKLFNQKIETLPPLEDVVNVDFTKQVFTQNYLSNKKFINCKFSFSIFSFNEIKNSLFQNCDLSNACLSFAKFKNCKFENSKIKAVCAYKSIFDNDIIFNCNLQFSNYSFVKFYHCVMNKFKANNSLFLNTHFVKDIITNSDFSDIAFINCKSINTYIDNISLYKYNNKEFNKIIYCSIRESDALKAPYGKSISIFGSGLKGNESLNKLSNKRYNHNAIKNFELLDNFFEEKINTILERDKNARIMYYGKQRVPLLPKTIQEHIVCQNKPELLRLLDDKFASHKWAMNIVNCVEYKYALGSQINLEYCKKLFGDNYDAFVIQWHESSGGEQTFLLNANSESILKKRLIANEEYSISIYYKNISTNVHFLIAEENEIIFPPSVQIIDIKNNMMEYKGCDFIVYDKLISKILQNKTIQDTKKLIQALRELGYRGIGGVDYIVTKDNVYFMEINPRYQSSTNVLNLALSQNNLPTVNELDYKCFTVKKLPQLRKFKVEYSKQCISNGSAKEIRKFKKYLIKDGFNNRESLEDDVYLYTVIYKSSLWDSLCKNNTSN